MMMKRIVTLSLMAIACLAVQAQEKNNVTVLAKQWYLDVNASGSHG